MSDSPLPRALLFPRHWPAWLGAGIWFLLAQLPYRIQRWLAYVLGLGLWFNKRRRHYAERNLQLCFPGLTDGERRKLLRANLFSTAMALFETGMAWFWPAWRLCRLYSVSGLEHLEEAQRNGQGVL